MIEIRILKYQYHATQLIRTLNDMGFTIYRKKLRAGLRTDSRLIQWTVSVPRLTNSERDDSKKEFMKLSRAVDQILFDIEGVEKASGWVRTFDFGYYKIMDCSFLDASFQVVQHHKA